MGKVFSCIMNTQIEEYNTSDTESTQNGEEIEEITEESIEKQHKIYKKKDKSVATFDKLIETLYDAGLKAQRNVQYSNLHHLETFFEDTDEDGVLEPKLIKIKIPSHSKDEDKKWETIEIPLFTLVNHNCLKIENLKVKFKIDFGDMKIEKFDKKEHKKLICQNSRGVHKRKWKIQINKPGNKNKNYADVEIDFKYDSPLESIVRLSERYSSII